MLQAHHNLADILFTQGEPEEALGCAQRALHARPSFAQARAVSALSLEEMGRIPEAVAEVEEGLDGGKRGDYALMYHRARLVKSLGRFKDADVAFRAVLSESGGTPQVMSLTSPDLQARADGVPQVTAYAHNEYGHLLGELGREGEARLQWERSVHADPTFARGWVNIAASHSGSGDVEEQVAAYVKALNIDPTLTEAWINIGQVEFCVHLILLMT